MPFDEEDRDPHGECAAEIRRLQAEIEKLQSLVGDIFYAALKGHEGNDPAGACATIADTAQVELRHRGILVGDALVAALMSTIER